MRVRWIELREPEVRGSNPRLVTIMNFLKQLFRICKIGILFESEERGRNTVQINGKELFWRFQLAHEEATPVGLRNFDADSLNYFWCVRAVGQFNGP